VLPITIFKTGLRILGLSWLATHVNPSFLSGRLHTDGGVVFFLVALALLAPIFEVLRRLDSPRTLPEQRVRALATTSAMTTNNTTQRTIDD
jgi:hypothetical protein